MSPRMHGAEIEALVEPVMQAWNNASTTGRRAAAMTAVVNAAWPWGYAAGVVDGHALVTDYFVRIAQQTMTQQGTRLDPLSQQMLRAVDGVAAAVSFAWPTVTDEGPSRRDYLTATGDVNGTTDAEDAAAASRVGWTHGYKAGNADAGWSAAARIVSAVGNLVGTDTIERVRIDGQTGSDWLNRVDVDSRSDPHERSAAAQAFSPLRQVHAAPASDAIATPGEASRQRQGRSR
jgi:hypothetical protein